MSEMGLLLALWTGLAVVAWAGIVYGIPRCERSRFRYDLWGLRDEIVDALLEEKVGRGAAVDHLRKQIEWTIRNADAVTPIDFALVTWSTECIDPSHAAPDLSGLSIEDRQMINRWRKKFAIILARHLIRGSTSGWMFFWCMTPALALRNLLARREGQKARSVVEKRVRREVRRHPALVEPRPGGRAGERPLSACSK